MSNLPDEEPRNWQNVQNFDSIPNDSQFQAHHSEVYGFGNIPAPGRYQPMSESYSVLPVGHGNFLKVYHSNENEPQTFNSYELFSSNSLIPPQTILMEKKENNNTSTIINQLVTNWTPNVSGNYSPFGEQQQQQQQHQQKIINQQLQSQPTIPSSQNSPAKDFIAAASVISSEMIKEQSGKSQLLTPQAKHEIKGSKTNGSFESHQMNAPEIKKRIVAEVKPMRMSYSDVLSKNVDVNAVSPNGTNNLNPSTTETLANAKSAKYPVEKIKNVGGYSSSDRKSQFDDKDKHDAKNKKIDSNTHYKTDESAINGYNKEKKKIIVDDNKDSSGGTAAKKASKKPITEKNKAKTSGSNAPESTKKRSNKRDIDDESKLKSTNDKEYFYNVAKTEINFEKSQKYTQNTGTKKTRQSSGQKNYNNNNASNSSSTQRSERQNYSKTRGQKPRRDPKYELISKFIEKWLEYTLKILTWLFYLIYDVIVLSFGIGLDRLKLLYSNSFTFFTNLRKDLKNNSGKPNAWIKNLFKKFDNKFKKNSKWAFWRKFNKKKQGEEYLTDFYKNGRLPQTGDEAMYSLLNCKGKDAYSILGVSMESSQEQIRKHYKKIAVLVHPDKNKQPGAEEAFKVLQRAFELIGEPENRKSYDQSLAQALNTEKAWSELHDLLSQLQSKIAEAANTIRCSSCGLRHPRKLTDRPHYAARECSSCKIRHSAREGDIWAETSVFGLRWKYLALMEGKCYDITEWANCQKGALSHLQPNSHIVQYRIVRGAQQQQQQQQQHHQNVTLEKEKLKRDQASEPSLDEFLDNLYSGQNPQQNSSRKRSKRN